MEHQIFTDPLIEPDETVLQTALGKNYSLFQEFTAKTGERNLVPQWKYYRDVKTWLCKVLYKKKNLCWLSVWNTGFKLTFYFPEKFFEGLFRMDISDEIKKAAAEMKPVGKSHPVIILIKTKKRLNDGIKLIDYKKTQK